MALKSPVGACYSGDVMNKLNQDYDSVLYEQQRLQLLYSMKKKSIYTRDIMSFAENQAESRRELKGIDVKIVIKTCHKSFKESCYMTKDCQH